MNNLTREELEYHLCDIGLDLTMSRYHVTAKEVEAVLNAKVYGESPRFKYVERNRDPRLSPVENGVNVIELYRVIKENYDAIHDFVAKDKLTINNQSLTKEDIFHNTLLRILKDAGSFVYVDDETTIHMINKSIKNTSLNELKANEITKEKTEQFKILCGIL